MKTFYTILLLVVGTIMVNAQEVSEKDISMSLGSQTAFSIDIAEADYDATEKIWKRFIKDYGKTKRNKKAKEYYCTQINVPMIAGSNPTDLYVKFEERVGFTTAYLWIDLEEGFVNSDENPRAAKGAEEFLMQFSDETRKYVVNEEMKDQEKELKSLDKGLRKLEKKNTDYHKDIEKAKLKIEEMERNIEQNLKDQDDARIKIEMQKKVIETVIEKLNNIGQR